MRHASPETTIRGVRKMIKSRFEGVQIEIEMLPSILREIAEVIGVDKALAISEHYGGSTLYIPMVPRKNHPLVAIIGFQETHALAKMLKGEIAYIPTLKRVEEGIRKAAIIESVRKGVAKREIAKTHGLSVREIHRKSRKYAR